MSTIPVNNIDMYYELHGPEDGPVLVLNNGVLMNAATSWGFQTRVLARRCRVVQYDCRGQGQSSHPAGPYRMQQHAADLAALLEALEIPAAHLAGISYGGEVIQRFALDYPQKTLSLILADTVSEIGAELRAAVLSWIYAAKQQDTDAFFNATLPWNFSPNFIAANPALFADAHRRYALLDYPAVVALCECFLEVNITARLSEIKAPACVIVGERDLLKGPAYAEILYRNLPDAELHVLPGAGHASSWERPEEFNTIVLGFLAKQV